MTTNRAYTAGHFYLTLDDLPDDPGYIKSIDGGYLKGQVATEPIGPDNVQYKHVSTVEVEPIGFEIGMALSEFMVDWIRKSWKRQFARHNGALIHADFNYKPQLEQSFTGALVTEVAFPALDGSDKKPAYLNVKLQPEMVEYKQISGDRTAKFSRKQKLWSPSNFRLHIGNIDCSHVSKIDGFTVKQKVKKLYVGGERLPLIEPTGIEFPNMTFYMPLAHAKPFLDWYNAYIVKGERDTTQEKYGWIEFLSPDLRTSLIHIEMYNMGIISLSIEKSEANSDSVKRVKVECYVEKFDITHGTGLE